MDLFFSRAVAEFGFVFFGSEEMRKSHMVNRKGKKELFFQIKTELQGGISRVMPQGCMSTLRARGTPEIGGDAGPELCGCLLLPYLSQGHLGRCKCRARLEAKSG